MHVKLGIRRDIGPYMRVVKDGRDVLVFDQTDDGRSRFNVFGEDGAVLARVVGQNTPDGFDEALPKLLDDEWGIDCAQYLRMLMTVNKALTVIGTKVMFANLLTTASWDDVLFEDEMEVAA